VTENGAILLPFQARESIVYTSSRNDTTLV